MMLRISIRWISPTHESSWTESKLFLYQEGMVTGQGSKIKNSMWFDHSAFDTLEVWQHSAWGCSSLTPEQIMQEVVHSNIKKHYSAQTKFMKKTKIWHQKILDFNQFNIFCNHWSLWQIGANLLCHQRLYTDPLLTKRIITWDPSLVSQMHGAIKWLRRCVLNIDQLQAWSWGFDLFDMQHPMM